MFQAGLEWCWMRNKDFYLGILEEISARMEQFDITLDELSLASGLEPKRLMHIFDGMIEDLGRHAFQQALVSIFKQADNQRHAPIPAWLAQHAASLSPSRSSSCCTLRSVWASARSCSASHSCSVEIAAESRRRQSL